VTYKLPKDIYEDDVYQWLNDGWVTHPDYGVLKFLGELDSFDKTAEFSLDGEPMRLLYLELECFWPIGCMINHTKRGDRAAVYVQRNQRRQWRRTFNPMCVSTSVIGRWGMTKKSGNQRARMFTNIDYDLVSNLFDPIYYAPALAMRMIQAREAISVAITPQVAICGDGKHNFAIYYRDRVVGGITNGKYTPVVVGKVAEMAERIVKEALDES